MAILGLTVFLSACRENPRFGETTIQVSSKPLFVQTAITDLQHERGLMFRTTVAPYDGMIFIFKSPQKVAFWMKNTLIPLEVGYFNKEGILVEIHSMIPHDMTPIPSSHEDILYALELPIGDFARKGLKIGDKIFVPTNL